MQFSALLAFTLAVTAPAVLVNSSTKLDINQKVYIENAPVLGDGAGEGALGGCHMFAPQHIANPAAPTVKVCGTGIKTTIFFRMAKSLAKREQALLPVTSNDACIVDPRSLAQLKRAGCKNEECHRG